MATLKLSKKAKLFHDPSTGITFKKLDIKDLNEAQMANPAIKTALRRGILVYAEENTYSAKTEEKKEKEASLKKLDDLVSMGATPQKISTKFTLDELKNLSKELDIEIEDGDTKETLATAIYEAMAK